MKDTKFPAYRDLSEKQQNVLNKLWQESARTAEQQSDGTKFYKLYYIEVEEFRYDEEVDDLVPTEVFLCWNGPKD